MFMLVQVLSYKLEIFRVPRFYQYIPYFSSGGFQIILRSYVRADWKKSYQYSARHLNPTKSNLDVTVFLRILTNFEEFCTVLNSFFSSVILTDEI